MDAGEIRSVIRVELGRNAARAPAGIGFPPDGLVQDQRCLRCAGGGKPEEIAGNRPAVVIEDNGEPGSLGFSRIVEDEDWQERVVGLPYVVRRSRLVAVDQVKLLLVRLRSLMRERRQRRSKPADDPADGAGAWRRPAPLPADAFRFAVDGRNSPARLLEGQSLDRPLCSVGESARRRPWSFRVARRRPPSPCVRYRRTQRRRVRTLRPLAAAMWVNGISSSRKGRMRRKLSSAVARCVSDAPESPRWAGAGVAIASTTPPDYGVR